MKFVKKLVLVTIFGLSATGAFAQFSVAGGLSFGTEIENLGLFARGAYDITDQIRGNATLNFFFGESAGESGIAEVKTSLWTINLDGHYLFLEDNVNVYGLAGINLSNVRVKFEDGTGIIGDFTETNTEFGLNVGGGVEFPLETIRPFAEVKYVISDFDQLVIMAGVRYPIN